MNKIYIIVIALLLVIRASAQTPSWQWIKAGGANSSLTTNGLNYKTKQIGTDAQGNVYGIASVGSAGIAIDTLTAVNGYGYDDFVVFSYSCEGEFRWMKRFGNIAADIPGGLIVDKEGGVYVSGNVYIGPYGDGHIGDSTIIASNNYSKGYFIAKLDKYGDIVYINFPGPPVISVGAWPIRMEADKDGNPVVLTWFSDSATWNGHHINGRGYYLVKFDKTNGNLTEISPLDFRTRHNSGYIYESLFFTIDENNDIYVNVAFNDSLFIGNDTLVNDFINLDSTHYVLAKFGFDGSHKWHTVVTSYGSTTGFQSIWGKPLVYGNNVYIEAHTRSYPSSKFMGVPISNPNAWSNFIVTSLFASFNKNTGTFKSVINLWNKYRLESTPINIQNNSIIAGGAGGGLILMGSNDTIKPYDNGTTIYSYPFIISMDTALIHFNWGVATKTVLPSTGMTPEYLHVDHNDNIILGGSMNGPITNTAGDTTYPVAGLDNFSIAKIALSNDSCDCIASIPSLYIVSSLGNTLTVKGSATHQPDSLYIVWGDGDSTLYSNPGTNISHSYTNTGPWNVCLKSYAYCGDKDTCLLNLYSGIANSDDEESYFSVYPNPSSDKVNIDFNKVPDGGMELLIYDLTGRLVQSVLIGNERHTTIDISNLNKGVYILNIRSGDGRNKSIRVIRN